LRLNEELNRNVLKICRKIAGSNEIVGICVCGLAALENAPKREVDVDVLAVIRDFQPRILVYAKPLNKNSLVVSAVDQWVFEKDVEKALIGEVVAEKILFAYHAIANEEYFAKHEVAAKKRVVRELLENLIIEYPELSRELLIEPEYFLYESVTRRAKLFPLAIHSFVCVLKEKEKRRLMEGFEKAFEILEKEGVIEFDEGYIRITEKLVRKTGRIKMQMLSFFKNFQKAFFGYTLGLLPKTINAFSQYREKLLKPYSNTDEEKLFRLLENPRKHVYVSTPLGKVSLADRTDIQDFARKLVSDEKGFTVETEDIGGILNDVYLIRIKEDTHERKMVAKRFMDWQNFKWFSLALWSLGTQTFAVQGLSRLEREYAINKLLQSQNFHVPKILHVSMEKRLLFREYVEGKKLTEVIKRIFKAEYRKEITDELKIIEKVGGEMARIHALGVSLGDTKPENIMVSEGEIFFLDLEQASRNGNQPWDIAEFLYYAGHYASLTTKVKTVRWLTQAFIRGYLNAGGKPLNVEKAASPLYTKVFSIFTLPNVLFAISNLCKEAVKKENVSLGES